MEAPTLPDVSEIVGLLRELGAGQKRLEAQMATLTTRLAPGPRDHTDAALVGIIAAVAGGLPFTSAALWRRRAVDPTLAAAVLGADLDSARQLGKFLRRLEGRDVDGVRITCVGMDREGKIWRAARVQE